MADAVYVGDVTILGVTGTAQCGIAFLEDVQQMAASDHFKLAEQYDTIGDVVRVTPWRHYREITLTVYPTSVMVGPFVSLTLPEPMSLINISKRVGAVWDCPAFFVGNWWYVGGGTMTQTNTGLMAMKLVARKYNPLYA